MSVLEIIIYYIKGYSTDSLSNQLYVLYVPCGSDNVIRVICLETWRFLESLHFKLGLWNWKDEGEGETIERCFQVALWKCRL